LALEEILVHRLPIGEPPIPEGGGRITTPAGELAQIVSGGSYAFLAYIEFLPDETKPRGNHYHAIKTETLYIIKGSLRAVYRDIERGTMREVALSAGDRVTIPPKVAHVYYASEYTQTVELADLPYDPNDTISLRLEG
jgi:mannose-6-phosphate isomerase-like protein (cupin superfamily)